MPVRHTLVGDSDGDVAGAGFLEDGADGVAALDALNSGQDGFDLFLVQVSYLCGDGPH
jgi:hypothetical protein